MLRIAIVGCGKIADQHVQAICRVPQCRIVSVCDQEILMAMQLGDRFGFSDCFSDLAEMLEATSPEVVHITTPPQSHFSLAKQCLESGSHVYLEKPFTVAAEEPDSYGTERVLIRLPNFGFWAKAGGRLAKLIYGRQNE